MIQQAGWVRNLEEETGWSQKSWGQSEKAELALHCRQVNRQNGCMGVWRWSEPTEWFYWWMEMEWTNIMVLRVDGDGVNQVNRHTGFTGGWRLSDPSEPTCWFNGWMEIEWFERTNMLVLRVYGDGVNQVNQHAGFTGVRRWSEPSEPTCWFYGWMEMDGTHRGKVNWPRQWPTQVVKYTNYKEDGKPMISETLRLGGMVIT